MDPLTIPAREKENTVQYAPSELQDTPYEHERRTQPQHKDTNENFIIEVLKFAVLALCIVLPFRIYIAEPFIVSGASMSPTFHTGEYLIVDRLSYRLDEPKRGDVVVFRYPNNPSEHYIKRIVGLPGEIVQLANGITTIVDPETQKQTVLEEKYLVTDKTDDHLSITLSSDEYFVMGDNRSASSDSRSWGPVPRNNMVGRAFLRLLPLSVIDFLPGAYTFPTEFEQTNNVL